MMTCPQCNKPTDSAQFCTRCGASFTQEQQKEMMANNLSVESTSPITKGMTLTKVLRIVVGLAAIAFVIYLRIDDNAIRQNNDALSNYSSNNTSEAIVQFQNAINSAVTDETKLTAMMNLAYTYSSNLQNDQALDMFKQALALTKEGSFDHHLVSGEIATLEKKPADAEKHLLEAYALEPKDFQSNNALGLFYLDLDGIAPDLANPAKAIPYLQQAYAVNDEEYVRLNLGLGYFFNEQYDDVITLLSQADFSKEPSSALWVGLAYMRKEDAPNARSYFEKARSFGVELPESVQKFLDENPA